MKLSLQWLKEYVDLPSQITPQKLAYDITMSTVEVEAVHQLKEEFAGMVVGQVLEISPHPKADRLRIAKTLIAPGDARTVVCGGSNLTPGMFVALGLPGALVRWHGEGEPVKLEITKIRGVESFGMICASNEVGLADLFPATAESEIIDLTPLTKMGMELAPGMPLAEALGLDDVILHIDNKSLTNRPDLWGHYGMARELAAIYGCTLRPLPSQQLVAENVDLLRVAIEDPQRCSRYIGTVIDGCSVRETPFWMRRRLHLMGQRSINLLVDLTNYVMFALGQPVHVFDYERVAGKQIVVRRAKRGEYLQLLDGKKYDLLDQDLIIADGKAPVALAGVMGGEVSGVAATTRRIVFESASFEPIGIRRSATRLGLRSESSMRFEKGIDAARARLAVDLFLKLLKESDAGTKVLSCCDCFPNPPKALTVEVELEFIESRIGQKLTEADVQRRLESLGFQVSRAGKGFHLVVPTWRATGDVSIAEDIVEEVARLIGYDNLQFVPPPVQLTQAVIQPQFAIVQQTREHLSAREGLNEVLTYPWIEENFLQAAGIDPEKCVQLQSPPSHAARALQPSLIPGMLFAAERNARYFKSFGVFQVSRVFDPSAVYPVCGKSEKLPAQPRLVALAIVGESDRDTYLRAKGVVEGLLPGVKRSAAEFRALDVAPPAWAAKGSALEVCCSGKSVGALGLLSLPAAQKAGIADVAVALAELSIDTLASLPAQISNYKALPQYPMVDFELSLIFDEKVRWADIARSLIGCDPLVVGAAFLDEYRGEQVPAGKKSISLRLTLSDQKGTINSEQSAKVANSVVERLKSSYGAELRAS
ncbi:MAG: phenylalanine--tRNA ligase subunit beta [Oligoflexia bacterium]|nr:phenylalanine--tRNA ligase subunit beta [Oligoflexia bacterium]